MAQLGQFGYLLWGSLTDGYYRTIFLLYLRLRSLDYRVKGFEIILFEGPQGLIEAFLLDLLQYRIVDMISISSLEASAAMTQNLLLSRPPILFNLRHLELVLGYRPGLVRA